MFSLQLLIGCISRSNRRRGGHPSHACLCEAVHFRSLMAVDFSSQWPQATRSWSKRGRGRGSFDFWAVLRIQAQRDIRDGARGRREYWREKLARDSQRLYIEARISFAHSPSPMFCTLTSSPSSSPSPDSPCVSKSGSSRSPGHLSMFRSGNRSYCISVPCGRSEVTGGGHIYTLFGGIKDTNGGDLDDHLCRKALK